MAEGARERREAIRQLADLRRRLAVAEGALTDALATAAAKTAWLWYMASDGGGGIVEDRAS